MTVVARGLTTRVCTLALAVSVLAGCGVPEDGIDPPDDALYFPIAAAPHPDGRYLFVSNAVFDRQYNAGTLVVYDTFARRIVPESTVRIGLFGGELVAGRGPDGQLRLYTPTRDDSRLWQIDVTDTADGPPTLTASAHSDFGTRSFEREPYGISLDPDGEGLVVTHIARGIVSRWSAGGAAPAFRCSLNVLDGATAVVRHPVLGWWYVSDRFERRIKVVAEQLDDLPEGAIPEEACRLVQVSTILVDAFDTRGRTRGMAFNSEGTLLFVASSSDRSLRAYDTTVLGNGLPNNRLVTALGLGGTPNLVRVAGCRGDACGPDANPDSVAVKGGGLVYVTLFNDDRVLVIDPASLSVIARIEVGDGPNDIAFMLDDAGKLRGYVTGFSDNSLSVLDLEPGSPTRFTRIATIK